MNNEQKHLEYCLERWAEGQRLEIIKIHADGLYGWIEHELAIPGEGVVSRIKQISIDLDFWSQVPIKDYEKYFHELTLILEQEAGIYLVESMLEMAIQNAPIKDRMKALWDAEH